MDAASARDSSSDIPMSANTLLLSVTVASSTVERPSSVICTSVVRPSVGCGMRSHQAVGLEPADRVRDAGDVHLQPVGRLGDRQRAAAAECQQPQQFEAREAQVVGPQRVLDAGQQDLVGPHHRRHRDHAVGDVTPAGPLPIGARQRDRIGLLGRGRSGHASSYRMRGRRSGNWLDASRPVEPPPPAPPGWTAGRRR